MRKTNEIVLFETEDRSITLSVPVEHETVWEVKWQNCLVEMLRP